MIIIVRKKSQGLPWWEKWSLQSIHWWKILILNLILNTVAFVRKEKKGSVDFTSLIYLRQLCCQILLLLLCLRSFSTIKPQNITLTSCRGNCSPPASAIYMYRTGWAARTFRPGWKWNKCDKSGRGVHSFYVRKNRPPFTLPCYDQ